MDLDLLLTDVDDDLLAKALEVQGFNAGTESISARNDRGAAPLSYTQQRLWFLQQLDPKSTAYNSLCVFKVTGEISVPCFQRAFQLLIERHQVLASTFKQEGSEPLQRVSEQQVEIQLIDIGHLPAKHQSAQLDDWIQQESERPFDLSLEIPIRVSIIRQAGDSAFLLLSLHHIVTDAWTMGTLLRDFSACYHAAYGNKQPELAVLPIQYADYAVWQKKWLAGERLDEQLKYWKGYVSGCPFSIDLMTDFPRPVVQSSEGGREVFDLPQQLAADVRLMCQQQNTSPFALFMAVWQVLLWRYSRQNNFLVGVPNANRHRIEVEDLVGCFINTQVFRAALDGNLTCSQLIEKLITDVANAQNYQDLPFDLLVEKLEEERDTSRNPLFQVMFNFQSEMITGLPGDELKLPGARLTSVMEPDPGAKCDLALNIHTEGGGFSGSIQYGTALFKPDTITKIIRHYIHLLEVMVSQPDTRLCNLQLLDQTERDELAQVESLTADYGLADSWLNRFAEQVQSKPESIVVSDDQGEMTFAELDGLSSQVAASLQQTGVGPDDVVAILAERNRGFIVSLVGILKAGAAWLPLSPTQPAARWQQVLDGAQVKAVLADEQHLAEVEQALPKGAPVLNYQSLLAGKGEYTQVTEQPGQLAYVLFTSGSTGTPKGVMVSREGMLNNMLAKVTPLGLSETDVIAQTAGQCFDICVWQMLTAPILGCRVHIVDEETVRDPQGLTASLNQQGVTITELVPSLLQAVLETETDTLTSLRWVLPTGEALPPALATSWFSHYPHIPLMNAYGPAECADDVAFAPLYAAPDESVVNMPIGLPTANASLYVVDDALNRVPTGVVGELAVGGVGVGRGYREEPGKTAALFVPNPFSDKGERLYLTGDLVKRGADGQLEYIGRKDFQVKIRGQRIELGEIEAALEKQGGVKQAVVTASEVGSSQHLVAYISGDAAADSELKQQLSEVLPGYMVPSLIVRLAQLPLSSNGKVDRKALPAPDFSAVQKQYQAPETETEYRLAVIWQELLQVEQVGRTDNFFELGGHSLLATRLVSQIERQMGKQLSLISVFETPTLMSQAQALEESEESRLPALVKVPRSDRMPLSFAQQRMWMLEQLEGGQTYLMPGALKLEGQLDVKALEQSFSDLVERHEALRTRIVVEAGESYQCIDEAQAFSLGYDDLSESATKEGQLATLIEGNAREVFDLSQAPLFRARLVKLNEGEHVLLYALHHIIGDEWSGQLLIEEMSQAYSSRLSGYAPQWPVLDVQYVDYAVWQREWLQGEVLELQLAYWRGELGEQHPVLELPYDYARPAAQSFAGDSIAFVLPDELSLQVQSFSRKQGFTLFQFMLACFQVLLAKYSGQQEVRVGVPIANRTHGETEGLVGCFINTQVMALSLSGSDSLLSLLNQTKAKAIAAQAHQEIPFEKLVEELNVPRDLSYSPLFQVMFNLQQAAVGKQSLELDRLTLTALKDKNTTAKFDLTLDMTEEAGALSGSFEYCTALFKPGSIGQLIRHYIHLLDVMVSQPDTRLCNLQLLDQTERDELAQVESLSADYGLADSWLNRFAEQVQSKPESIVVSDDQGEMTFAELDGLSSQVAASLQQTGVGPDDVVAILAERNRGFIVSLVGILKAGAAWLPLSPTQPAARWQQVLDGAQVKAVLADEQQLVEAEQALTKGAPVLNYQSLLAGKGEYTQVTEQPGQLAYVLFTSGSTGTPKGVMVSREGMLNNMLAKVTPLGLSETDVIAQTAGQCFDICVWQMLTAPILGCRVHIVDEETVRDPQGLTASLNQQGVTITELVPSLLQAVLETETDTLTSLRWVLPTGEALPPALATSWFSHYPHIPLMNAYGPAECADDVAFAPLYAAPDESVVNMPIGLPTANASLYVVDDALNRVPTGVVGELAVGGVGVGRGYREEPGKTAALFVPNPFSDKGERLYLTGDLVKRGADGQLEYIGRKDFQVKIRGQRIELGEIEAALEKQGGVKQAVVTASEVGSSQHLVAYISGDAAADSELKQQLSEVLPGYMVPSLIVRLAQLPLSSNGKVDRKALPAPDFSAVQKEYQAPETETEYRLAVIWQELLQVEQVGRTDNFFELGGHSLLATRLVSQIERQMNKQLTLKAVFEAPTLMGQARELKESVASQLPKLTRANRSKTMPLSYAQQRLWIVDQLEGVGTAYNMPVLLKISGELQVTALERAIALLIKRHEILRTTYIERNDEPVQIIGEGEEFNLTIHDITELDEQAQQRALIAAEVNTEFDLASSLMLKASLIKQGKNSFILTLVTHHIASDDWSMQVMANDLIQLYSALSQGRTADASELTVQYADFAVWQKQCLQGAYLSRTKAFWRDYMYGAPQVLDLPLDFARVNTQEREGGKVELLIDKRLTQELNELATQHQVSLFMLLLASFNLTLHRTRGLKDIVLGTDLAGRTDSQLERLIGFFINVLPVRIKLDGAISFSELLRQVKVNTLAVFDNQHMPFDLLVDTLKPERNKHYQPIVQSLFVMQNVQKAKVEVPGLEISSLQENESESKFEMATFVSEQDGVIGVNCTYRKALFKEASVQHLMSNYLHILEQLVRKPERLLSQFDVLESKEKNATATKTLKSKGSKLGKLRKLKTKATL